MPDSTLEVISKLHGIGIFADLSLTAIEALAKNCQIKQYTKGQTILHAEEETTDMYCVLSGTVRVSNYALSGREIVYDDIHAGGIFGEICAIDGLGRSAQVAAIEPVRVAEIRRKVFLETLESYPQVAIALAQHLVAIIRVSGQRIIDTSTKSSRLRLLSAILNMADEKGRVENGHIVITGFPTHRDLAGKIGCTRETVTRLLQALGEEGLITRETATLSIPDIQALREALALEQSNE